MSSSFAYSNISRQSARRFFSRPLFSILLILLTLSLLLSEARPQSIQPWVNVRDFGATGNGTTDDTNAIVAAIAAARQSSPRSAVYIPAGTYRYNRVIKVDSIMIYGEGASRSTLLAADSAKSSLILTGTAPKICDVRIRAAITPTVRDTRSDATGLDVCDATDFAIQRVHIGPVASAGIFVRRSRGTDATPATIRDCIVENTLADGIHMTESSSYIDVVQNRVTKTGDDFIAVVSYRWNTALTREIFISKNTLSVQNHGRGISVVGGENVVIDSNSVTQSSGAGIYLASEASWNTYGTTNVIVRDNALTNVAKDSSGHGGIHITGRPAANNLSYLVKNITVVGNRVSDTGGNGATIASNSKNVHFTGNEISDTGRNGIIVGNTTSDIFIGADNDEPNVIRNCKEYGIYVMPRYSSGTLRISRVLLQNLNMRRLGHIDAVNIETGSNFSSIQLSNIRLEQPPANLIERFIESASTVNSSYGNSSNRTLSSVVPLKLAIGPLP